MRLLFKQNLLNHCHLINDDYLGMLQCNANILKNLKGN